MFPEGPAPLAPAMSYHQVLERPGGEPLEAT